MATKTSKPIKQRKPAGPKPQVVQRLAAKIARDVFKVGDEGKWKCNRIAFKSGDWPVGERDLGGLIESALAGVIERSLIVHLVKVNPIQVGARFD